MFDNLLFLVSILALWLHFIGFLKKLFEMHQLETFWPAYCLRWGSDGERRPNDWFYEVAHNSRSVWGDRFLGAALVVSASMLVYLAFWGELTAVTGWGFAASLVFGGLVLLSRWIAPLERLLMAPIRPLGVPKFEVATFREYHSIGMLLTALSGIAMGVIAFAMLTQPIA